MTIFSRLERILLKMDNAKTPCKVLYRPKDEKYAENIRKFQGCPTVAVTRKGRVYLGWYSGGVREPDMDNYNILVYGDGKGKFSEPLLIIPSEKERLVHALDIQLWIAPNCSLWVFWVQNNVIKQVSDELPERLAGQPLVAHEGYVYNDFRHTEWCIVCDDPDAENPVFSEPRLLDIGFLRCKPLVLNDGSWIFFNYDQITDRYGYSVSKDEGKTFARYYGAKKLATHFDEAMAYQRLDGSVRMLARTSLSELAECVSDDGAITWSEAKLSGIDSPNTRFYVSRTPSGRVLLVNNDSREGRKNMTVYLSEDDGKTWKYKKRINDDRMGPSYPDVDFYNGKIYLTYDCQRTGAKEILFLTFTENDIIDENTVLTPTIASKPYFS